MGGSWVPFLSHLLALLKGSRYKYEGFTAALPQSLPSALAPLERGCRLRVLLTSKGAQSHPVVAKALGKGRR